MATLALSLTSTVVSTSRIGEPASAAVRASARVSLGKHEPPKPGPACRNLRPMRLSRPMPRATCCTSAPTFSQRSAISLMKVIFIARKALAAYLISSEVRRLVNRIGCSLQIERPVDFAHHRRAALVLDADDHAIGPFEIVDRGALAQELRVGDDGESVLRRAFADDPLDRVAGADRRRSTC